MIKPWGSLSMAKSSSETLAFHGPFLASNQELFGEVLIKGSGSSLTLRSSSEINLGALPRYIHGSSVDGQKISCIDCIWASQSRSTRVQVSYHSAKLFPHHVVVGDEHLDPTAQNIHRLDFSVSDLSTLFYDFDAFGLVIDAAPIMDVVLAQNRKIRAIEVGEWPEVHYFTGKINVIEVDTALGKIAVRHRPTFSMGGPLGNHMTNEMVVSLEPGQPLHFSEAIDRVALLRRFLSVAAGRPQKIKNLEITTTTADPARSRSLQVHWSYAPKGPRGDHHKPSPGDLPLDPIHHPEAFATVIKNWIAGDERLKIARNRYVSCLEKRSTYGVDRLVAAANMFDLLPPDAAPAVQALPDDLAMFQAAALKTLGTFAQSQDRDSVISAITRMGKPSLPKRVLHRWATTKTDVAKVFPDLDYVLNQAIKCRNHFVHGASKSFKFERAEPFVFFLTDALEFVFAFSDLVEAGWSAKEWATRPYGDGHTFTRFRWGYAQTLAAFKAAMENPA